jgi:hypothetical protein
MQNGMGFPPLISNIFERPTTSTANGPSKILSDGSIRWHKGIEYLIERNGKIVSYGEN